jgi:hypothetical protein
LLLSSVAGGIVYFLLGWLFYDVLFINIYPSGEEENMISVFLGCLTYAVLIAYIYLQWANISLPVTGAKAGAVLGLLYGLSMNFFIYSNMAFNVTNMLLDILITIVCSAIIGGVIAWVIGKL